jgi:hypothetical protein
MPLLLYATDTEGLSGGEEYLAALLPTRSAKRHASVLRAARRLRLFFVCGSPAIWGARSGGDEPPVVTSAFDGSSEAVEDGESGLLGSPATTRRWLPHW